ncbi:MAG: YiiX/YebB-like N1pC/P60 family cysteine hydrolase [Mariniphaga sp.]
MKINRLLIILIAILLSLSGCKGESETELLRSVNLQNGDLIFRRGRSVESHAVLITDSKCRFSHVGIICIENETPFVIHAVPEENKRGPDYIRKEKVQEFLAPENASEFSIYRSRFSKEVNTEAAQIANRLYHEKVLFDKSFDLTTTDQIYCTELVLIAFQTASNHALNLNTTQLNVFFGKLEILMPGNIIESSNFQTIINY